MPSSGTLTKVHIVDAIAEINGFSRNKSFKKIEILLDLIKQSLESGEDVLISCFGQFIVKQKAKRKGRNPAAGNDITLKPRKVVKILCSGKLREKITPYIQKQTNF